MVHFVTLFDASFAIHGRLMIRSLLRTARAKRREPCFTIHVLALDSSAAAAVREETADCGVEVVVHDLDFLASRFPVRHLKETRSHAAFCWGLASMLCARMMEPDASGPGDLVVYLDADLYFYADPLVALREVRGGGASITAHPHRFPPGYEKWEVNGRFNIGMVMFRHDPAGMDCATEWARRCVERCDETTCGDQKYADEWPRFPHFAEFGKGVGVAPWNVFGYAVDFTPETGLTVDGVPVTCFHFHEARRLRPDSPPPLGNEIRRDGFTLTKGWPLRPSDLATFYDPYIAEYLALERQQA